MATSLSFQSLQILKAGTLVHQNMCLVSCTTLFVQQDKRFRNELRLYPKRQLLNSCGKAARRPEDFYPRLWVLRRTTACSSGRLLRRDGWHHQLVACRYSSHPTFVHEQGILFWPPVCPRCSDSRRLWHYLTRIDINQPRHLVRLVPSPIRLVCSRRCTTCGSPSCDFGQYDC